jgi:hypothetical protein
MPCVLSSWTVQSAHATRRIRFAQPMLAHAKATQYRPLSDARLQRRRQRSRPTAATQNVDLGSIGRHGSWQGKTKGVDGGPVPQLSRS